MYKVRKPRCTRRLLVSLVMALGNGTNTTGGDRDGVSDASEVRRGWGE